MSDATTTTTPEMEEGLVGTLAEILAIRDERNALREFKAFVHAYLDGKGVPTHPDGPHSKEGCRIGDRLDLVFASLDKLKKIQQRPEVEDAVRRLLSRRYGDTRIYASLLEPHNTDSEKLRRDELYVLDAYLTLCEL